MALPESLEELQEIKNIQDELSLSRGAVFIQDPKKRRKCPLCQQNIYLYYINFEEMFLMCENSNCDFPFGYEALQVVRNETELREKPVKATREFYEYPTQGGSELPQTLDSILGATGTISSMSCLSDCDGLSQMGDTDDGSLDKQETLAARLSREDLKRRNQQQKSEEVETNLKHFRKLTEEMNMLKGESQVDSKVIKNQKWLKNLKTWEEETGRKFLTEKENIELVKNEPQAPENELKISVGPAHVGGDNLTVNIQIITVKEEVQKKTENFTKDDQ